MPLPFSFDANSSEAENSADPNLNLRTRAQRIDLSHFPLMSKPPQEAIKVQKEAIVIPERLSRHTHLPLHSSAQMRDSEMYEEKENSDTPEQVSLAEAEPIQHLGHIPLTIADSVVMAEESWKEIFSRAADTEHRVQYLLSISPVIAQQPTKKLNSIIPKKRYAKVNFTLKEAMKLMATGVAIFLLTLVAMNFSAYSQIFNSFINPQRIAALTKSLDEITSSKNKLARQKLLPVAGIDRQITTKIPTVFNVMPVDNRLIIPKLGKNVPLIDGVGMDALLAENWKQLEESIQQGLKHGVVMYPGVAKPGTMGNVFITGHSSYYPWDDGHYKDVFALLRKLEVGDEYSILWKGNEYKYTIVQKKIVNPEDVSVLTQPADKELSTLMTCDPVGTTLHRLILVAERQQEK